MIKSTGCEFTPGCICDISIKSKLCVCNIDINHTFIFSLADLQTSTKDVILQRPDLMNVYVNIYIKNGLFL